MIHYFLFVNTLVFGYYDRLYEKIWQAKQEEI